MKLREKVSLTLVLVVLGATMGIVYNTYAGGNTIRYDVPLNIGESVATTNSAIDKVLKNPAIKALVDVKPSRIIATQRFMVKGQGYTENGTMTSSSTDIFISPSGTNGIEIKGVYSVVIITILYPDQSGYYIVYDIQSGDVGQPVFSMNVLA